MGFERHLSYVPRGAKGINMENYRPIWLLLFGTALLTSIVMLLEGPRTFSGVLTPIALFSGLVVFGLLLNGRSKRSK
jgi:hypothetical protein